MGPPCASHEQNHYTRSVANTRTEGKLFSLLICANRNIRNENQIRAGRDNQRGHGEYWQLARAARASSIRLGRSGARMAIKLSMRCLIEHLESR